MTPRKQHAILSIANEQKKQDRADLLALHTLAARGDPKEIKRQLDAAAKDAGE